MKLKCKISPLEFQPGFSNLPLVGQKIIRIVPPPKLTLLAENVAE